MMQLSPGVAQALPPCFQTPEQECDGTEGQEALQRTAGGLTTSGASTANKGAAAPLSELPGLQLQLPDPIPSVPVVQMGEIWGL